MEIAGGARKADDAPARSDVLEVVLPGGRTGRVTPGFDTVALRQLLDGREEPQPC